MDYTSNNDMMSSMSQNPQDACCSCADQSTDETAPKKDVPTVQMFGQLTKDGMLMLNGQLFSFVNMRDNQVKVNGQVVKGWLRSNGQVEVYLPVDFPMQGMNNGCMVGQLMPNGQLMLNGQAMNIQQMGPNQFMVNGQMMQGQLMPNNQIMLQTSMNNGMMNQQMMYQPMLGQLMPNGQLMLNGQIMNIHQMGPNQFMVNGQLMQGQLMPNNQIMLQMTGMNGFGF